MKYVERPLVIIVVALAIVQVFGVVIELIIDSKVLANHILRLVLVMLMVLYVGFSQHWLRKIREELKLYDTIWQSIPDGIASYNQQGHRTIFNREYARLQAYCSGQLHDAALERVLATGIGETFSYPITTLTGIKQMKSHFIPVHQSQLVHILNLISDRTEEGQAFAQREADYLEVVKVMVNMFELKDPFGQGHSATVSNLAHDLSKTLGMSQAEVEVITKAALIHDIGKATIPADVINQAELTDLNYEIIRTHASIGAEIAENVRGLRDAAQIVRHHHERYDGRGYPDGLEGEDIPLGARIVAVIDAFDAMTTGRSILGRRDVESAIAILKLEKGRQFDPKIVDDFTAMIQVGRNK